MKIYSPFRIVLLGLCLAAGYLSVTGSAQAITRTTAYSKADRFQHYICHHHMDRCGNQDFTTPHCNGPYGGNVQWSCSGFVTGMRGGRPMIGQVFSKWGPYGNLHYSRVDWSPLEILEFLAGAGKGLG